MIEFECTAVGRVKRSNFTAVGDIVDNRNLGTNTVETSKYCKSKLNSVYCSSTTNVPLYGGSKSREIRGAGVSID